MSKHLSRLGYCQYLLTSPTNYTLTNFANHVDDMSHDAITRYLRVERLTPRLVWDNVRTQVVAHADGCVLFDDTVLDKSGVQLLVDSMSYQYLVGAEIDYKDDLNGAQFVIKNPNATSTCGCGSSFSA